MPQGMFDVAVRAGSNARMEHLKAAMWEQHTLSLGQDGGGAVCRWGERPSRGPISGNLRHRILSSVSG